MDEGDGHLPPHHSIQSTKLPSCSNNYIILSTQKKRKKQRKTLYDLTFIQINPEPCRNLTFLFGLCLSNRQTLPHVPVCCIPYPVDSVRAQKRIVTFHWLLLYINNNITFFFWHIKTNPIFDMKIGSRASFNQKNTVTRTHGHMGWHIINRHKYKLLTLFMHSTIEFDDNNVVFICVSRWFNDGRFANAKHISHTSSTLKLKSKCNCWPKIIGTRSL